MPRGNDAQEALHELADRFGQGVGNAEMLIDANLAANTQALRKAQILPRDEELTAEAKKALRDGELNLEGPNGERVVSIAVRGSQDSPDRYRVVVVEDDEGRHHTFALDDDDNAIVGEYQLASGDAGRGAPDISKDEAKERRAKARSKSEARSEGEGEGDGEGGGDGPRRPAGAGREGGDGSKRPAGAGSGSRSSS